MNADVKGTNDGHHIVGVRGRAAFLLYLSVAVLILISLANLLTTCTLIGVLHISHNGMRDIEFLPERIKFFSTVFIHKLLLHRYSFLSGFDNGSISFLTSDAAINLVVSNGSSTRIFGHIEMDTPLFEVYNRKGDTLLFSSDFRKQRLAFDTIRSAVIEPFIQSYQIVSEPMLRVSSGKHVSIRSGNHIMSSSNQTVIEAPSSIALNVPERGKIKLAAPRGLYLPTLNQKFVYSSRRHPTLAFKLCICRAPFRVFRVTATFNCTFSKSDSVNPCSAY